MDYRFKYKRKIIKLLGVNMGENLGVLGFGTDFVIQYEGTLHGRKN